MSRHQGQADFVTPEDLDFPIHLIGCGGIGSWTCLMLAKMGCTNITVYDDDTVEDHNVASQFFKETQLNALKTEALMSNVLEQTGVKVKFLSNRFESEIADGLVILAIDSMDGRIELEEMFKDKNIFIIDGRMGGLQLEIYCTRSDSYKQTLCDPSSVDQDKCTAKAISFNCATIGSWIANFVRMYAHKNLKQRSVVFDFENMILIEEPLQSQTEEII